MNNTEVWIQELNILKSRFEIRQELLQEVLKTMAIDLSALTAQIAATASVEASAVTLINAIVAEIVASANDPTKVVELAAQLKAATDPLALAIATSPVSVANTP